MVETRRSNRLRSRSTDAAAESPALDEEKQQQREISSTPRSTRTPRTRRGRTKQRSSSETSLERRRKNRDDGVGNIKIAESAISSAQQQEKDIAEAAAAPAEKKVEGPEQREEKTKVAGTRPNILDGVQGDLEKGQLDEGRNNSTNEEEGDAKDANANPPSSLSERTSNLGAREDKEKSARGNKDGGGSSREEKLARKAKPATTNNSQPMRIGADPTMIKANKRTGAVSGKTNALSKLVPGYTAPPTLTSDSIMSKFRPAGGLEGLCRKALRNDPRTAKAMEASKKALQQPGGGAVAYGSSFKMGHCKRQRQPPGRAGDGWFGMRPTPMTDDVKKDLHLIRNRNYLDPKRFYKNPDLAGKLVQVGTVIEDPTEYYSSRLTKKQRRTNLVDEVLADPSTASYAENKYKEMQREKTALAMNRKKGRRGKR